VDAIATTSGLARHSRAASGTDSPDIEIAVIGAGPYGLSAGAHLKAKGFRVRVFGEPMDFWAEKMPEGMLLRSPRVASNISDPDSAFTLDAYEAVSGTEPTAPVPLKTFVEYGRWFRHQLGSDLDRRIVTRVDCDGDGFRLSLSDGESIRCQKVVVAAGIGPFCRKPAEFANLTSDQVSHCYEGRKLKEFSGKAVAVIGAGQSALESAALLHEGGAAVEVIAKIPELRWIGMHSWLHHLGPVSKMLYSRHDVGPVGISRLVAAPRLVNRIPLKLRDKIRKRAVRPAGSRWLPERLTNVKITTACAVQSASSIRGQVILKLDDGSERHVDHVLLGTGYDVDIDRYDFLSPKLVKSVLRLGGYPKLTSGFCSSVPGLHFIGATAARSFGPLMYFVAGTEFTSRELVSHIARRQRNAK
jgi:FAD-dependent urate hydroxylase